MRTPISLRPLESGCSDTTGVSAGILLFLPTGGWLTASCRCPEGAAGTAALCRMAASVVTRGDLRAGVSSTGGETVTFGGGSGGGLSPSGWMIGFQGATDRGIGRGDNAEEVSS